MTEEKLPQVANYNPPAKTDLNVILASMENGMRFGEIMIKSGTIPDRWKLAESVWSTVMRGADFGFSPIQSLEVFYIVHGKLAMDSHGIAALILNHGGTIETLEDDLKAQTIRLTRPGHPPLEYRFTIEDAARANLLTNSKYKELPRNMLYARALTFAARKLYADVLKGMKTKEELEDITPEESPAKALTATLLSPKVEVLPAPDIVIEKEPEALKQVKTELPLIERIGKLVDTMVAYDKVSLSDVEWWGRKFRKKKSLDHFTPDDFRALYELHLDLAGGLDPNSIFTGEE